MFSPGFIVFLVGALSISGAEWTVAASPIGVPLSEDQGLSPAFIKVADAATRPDNRQSAALSTAWFARSTNFTLVTFPAQWWQAVEWRAVAID